MKIERQELAPLPHRKAAGLASWLGQKLRKQRETQACIVRRTNTAARRVLPSHGLPSQDKNNDAICLDLQTCIYKHFMVLLPGQRGEFSSHDG